MDPKFGTPEELDDDSEPQEAFYPPGDLGKIALPILKEIVAHRVPEEDRERLTKFLDFTPPKDLEDFIVHVLEYGADRVFPKKKTCRRTS